MTTNRATGSHGPKCVRGLPQGSPWVLCHAETRCGILEEVHGAPKLARASEGA